MYSFVAVFQRHFRQWRVCVMRQIGGLGSLNAAYYCWIILFHVTAAFAVTCDFHVTSLVKACLGPNILGEVP